MSLATSFQRHLNILDYALDSLARRKTRNVGIFLVFTTIIFLFSSLQLMNRGLTEAAEKILVGAPDITVQQMSAGRQVPLSLSAAGQLDKIWGITRVEPRIWGYYFDEKNGANYTVVALGPEGLASAMDLVLAKGRLPTEDGEVIISEAVRRSMGLGQRRSFSLFRPDLSLASFTTSGTFAQSSSLVTADMLLMSIGDARDLFAMEHTQVTDLMVYVTNPREIDTVAAKIADRIPGVRVITRNQIMKTYSLVFSWRSGFGGVCLLTSLIAFVILAYDKASGLSREELQEVGILKILGWQTMDVMAIRFYQSAVLSLLAFASGYSIAWVHVVWLQGMLFQPLLLGWSVLRPCPEIVPLFDLGDFLVLFAVSVLPYLCATIVPAWRSGMVRPDTII